jgi:hypothetical protein
MTHNNSNSVQGTFFSPSVLILAFAIHRDVEFMSYIFGYVNLIGNPAHKLISQ